MGSYTKAFKSPNTAEGEWFWNTTSGSDIVADGGEGYHNLTDAENGYLAGQGIPADRRDIARQYLTRVKKTPGEYELVFNRSGYEQHSKGAKQWQ